MTIAPLSLPPFSHFYSSSLPPAIPLLSPNDLTTCESNQVLRHPLTASFTNVPRLGVEEGSSREFWPSDVAMDRDSAFQTSHSRVLRASLPFPSRRVRSSAFLVLQPPTAAIYFPSQALSRYRTRQQKCTRMSHIYKLNVDLLHPNSSFPSPSPFGLGEPITQVLAPATEFGRSSAHMKRCVKLVHSHNLVNRIGKVMYARPWRMPPARGLARRYISILHLVASRGFVSLFPLSFINIS